MLTPPRPTTPLRILLAQPRGFCAGVERAITIVEKALTIYGPPIYVRHEIVHNRWVVDDLKSKGVIFVEEIDEVPDNAITIFSAHGISEKVENSARLRNLPVIDATCPLVTKVHKEAQRYEQQGASIVLIGHNGHPEVEGTMGRVKNTVHLVSTVDDVKQLPPIASPLSYVTQTTLSVDDTKEIISALKHRFPHIQGPDLRDICYATQNRQNAIRALAEQVDLLLVVGAENSSNSNRLRDLGAEMGIPSHLISGAEAIHPEWFAADVRQVGISAGASAPEVLVQEVIAAVQMLRPGTTLEYMEGVEENIRFKLPPEVSDKAHYHTISASE